MRGRSPDRLPDAEEEPAARRIPEVDLSLLECQKRSGTLRRNDPEPALEEDENLIAGSYVTNNSTDYSELFGALTREPSPL